MGYNSYQKMHYSAMYSKADDAVKKQRKKQVYALFEGSNIVEYGQYPLLQHLRGERIKQGVPKHLLTIKNMTP